MELFDFLKNLHDRAIVLSKDIKFDKKNSRQFILISLYGSLIELNGCFIVLVNKKMWTGIPPIFRSIIETYIELKNLYTTAEYFYHMQASYYEQWLKVLKEARDNPNPFLNEVTKMEKLDSQISFDEKGLESLKDKGYLPLNIYQRFEKAGMINEYRSIYNFLSNDAHSNIRALINRHHKTQDDDFDVVFYMDKPIDNFLAYINHAAGLLVDSTGMIHDIFNTGLVGEVKILGEKLTELKKKLRLA